MLIKEYYKGGPDKLFDSEHNITWDYDDDDAVTFGFYPVSLDNEYQFFAAEKVTHFQLAMQAAKEFVGKEYWRLDKRELSALQTVCYAKSYGCGRYWRPINVIAFWKQPTNEVLSTAYDKLGIDMECKSSECQVTFEKNTRQALPISRFMRINAGGDNGDGAKSISWTSYGINELLDKVSKLKGNGNDWIEQKEKSGWGTIANRNYWLRQENKEINNKNMNKYKEEFSNYIGIMKEALERENFEAYDAAKDMLEESIEECRHEKELAAQLDTNNFGVLNHIFEERLPGLFVANKKAVRDVIKTIKEDANLMGEFNYYNAIKQYKGKLAESIEPDAVIAKLNEAIVATINKDTVNKSNAKFRKVLKEHNIIPNDFIDEEAKTLYESGHNILTKKLNAIGNVMTIAESSKNICDYMNKHKTDVIKEQIDPDKLIKQFKDRMRETLTESEMSFVKEITDWRSPIAEQRKEKLFNKFKNECIEKVDEMLKEDAGNVELESLKKQLEEQTFNKESIVQDIAKLLEIRDILLDK